jgi:hypothetical protein
MSKYYLSLDIGGTKTSASVFDENGNIVNNYVLKRKSETFKGEEAVYQNTKNVLEEILSELKIKKEDVIAMGVGSPGPLDTKKGIIIHAPLMGWENFPIVERLKEDFELPVYLDNDANLGALAEVRCGEGKGCKNLIYMTVSTGCGGGIIINNDIYRGSHDGAGEVGHMSVLPDGIDCPCGSKGCFELYASGTAINERMKADMLAGKKSLAFELAGHDPEKIDGSLLLKAASQNDEYALEAYRLEGYYLGLGIANLFNILDPEAIVLGGGVTKAKDYFHESCIKTLKKRCVHKVNDDMLRYSKLNDLVVLYGAYYLCKDREI